MDLNHLNLRVRDPDACRAFYERHFGFRLAWGSEGGWFLRGDEGFLLALLPAPSHPALPEGFHVGFGLASPAAVSVLRDALVEAGVTATRIDDAEDDYVTFRCQDPDGTEIEVFWEQP